MRRTSLVPIVLVAACATQSATEPPRAAPVRVEPARAPVVESAPVAESSAQGSVALPPAPSSTAPGATPPSSAPGTPLAAPTATTPAPPATPPAVVTRPELPFETSPEDRPHLVATGFLGTATGTLADGTQAVGPRVAGVRPGSGLAAAGVKERDVLVGIAGTTLRPGEPDPIGKFRELLLRQAPETSVDLDVWTDGAGLRTERVLLGRQPPAFARLDTPASWMTSNLANGTLDDVVREVLALDTGGSRYDDVLARNRKHTAKRDVFRLREVTEAHLNLTANEPIAIELATALSADPVGAASIAAGRRRDAASRGAMVANVPDTADLAAIVDAVATHLAAIDHLARAATAAWTDDDRAFVTANFEEMTERLNQGELIVDDDVVARERANRRTMALLAKVDRAKSAEAAQFARGLVDAAVPKLTAAAQAAIAAGRDGLLVAKDTPAGRIEVWGGGNQRHTTRCAFLFDLAGDDNYLDVAGRADLGQPVSIFVDASGSDLWAATSPFGLAGALGGVACVADLAGDDQYLSRDWSQGAAVGGVAILVDGAGRDVYHAQNLSQGIGMMGTGVLEDRAGDDLATGVRFCQGVGFPGGVGALVDHGGNDRYVCTGRYDSEYGEPGLYSGWGQGCGYGFRNLASGGIGVLLDESGDDVYEAGNFSQGGGYFYAWGVLWDAQGRDRYIGSRYAQGFAAHQAVGTFLEGGGDDLYQSHSGVAQGLSWDETSVVFHDMGGNDRYQSAGFSLASAAHNGMVLFLDDGGDDVYAGLPAHAGSNEYHGGTSFALFLDRGGNDVYVGADPKETWNDRAAVRDKGAYHVDLPGTGPWPIRTYLR